jgi:predicted dienelactone hydrolase
MKKVQNKSPEKSKTSIGVLLRITCQLGVVFCLILAADCSLIACSKFANYSTLSNSSLDHENKPMSPNFLYTATPGSYQVSVIDELSLTKVSGKQLPLKIYYPQGQGKFPVIIFSHGTGGSKDSYSRLGEFWASHGYISIHPTHADSLALRGETIGEGNLRRILASILKDSDSWQERASDISLIIDSLSKIENQAPQLKGKIDSDHLGVGGHSFGAYTAQLIGGATIDIPNGPKGKSFADHRVKSVLLLSPQGTGQQGLTRSSWDQMKLPMMVITGSLDGGAQGQGPEWKKEPFEFAPLGNKYLIFIQNANHFSFGGNLVQERGLGDASENLSGTTSNEPRISPRRGRQQELIFDYVKITSLAFWDGYLKDNNNAQDYLKNKRLQVDSKGSVSISIK